LIRLNPIWKFESTSASIFLDAGTALMVVNEMQENGESDGSPGSKKADVDSNFQIGLSLIKPAYFLIVFVNALSVSFLPQLVTEFAEKTGSTLASASLPFTVFYFVFAAVLIPAGQYAEHGDLKKLMAFGFICEVIGLSCVAMTSNYWILTLGRSASGIGQGVFLIGLQSYLLTVTPPDKRTQGAAVKVIGRNAGLIAGTAIGALLYAYMDYSGIFMLASVMSLVAMVYLWFLVPDVDTIAGDVIEDIKKSVEKKTGKLLHNILICLKDPEFMKALMFVGVIGKVAITGVVMFAIPLVLSKKGFVTEDIGQFLMLYYISSMVMTHFASKVVDALGKTKIVLFASTIFGGMGMALLGFIGVSEWKEGTVAIPGVAELGELAVTFNSGIMASGIEGLDTFMILFCLFLAGLSNGLLAAPVLTHINKTKAAETEGNKTITATYIFLERGGHVIGPIFVSFLFTVTNDSTLAISFYGVLTIVLGLAFILTSKKA